MALKMVDSTNSQPTLQENESKKKCDKCIKCCSDYRPRVPYTYTERACDDCCDGCDKPGIGSKNHDPNDNSCDDCALICVGCTSILDIICCIPMVFGCWIVEKR